MSTIDINEVKVRPATSPHDIDDVETALSRYHPLGYKRAIGARMFYLAMHRGDIVAVMIFDAPSDFNRMRDSEIGWSTEQCKQRRKHIANNSRFLVGRRYQNIPNLASKVLSLAADRISQDWMRRYGVPLLALETYVDPEYNDNHGTCYIAAGWKRLGLSTGYQERLKAPGSEDSIT